MSVCFTLRLEGSAREASVAGVALRLVDELDASIFESEDVVAFVDKALGRSTCWNVESVSLLNPFRE